MRLIWLKTELLHPVDRGGRIRTYHTLRALRHAHHITYVCLADQESLHAAVAPAQEYCHALVPVPHRHLARRTWAFALGAGRNVFSSLPFSAWRYRSPQMQMHVSRLIAELKPDLVVCDFLFPAINLPLDSGVPTLLFQHNVEAALWERLVTQAPTAVSRAYLRTQLRRLQRFEHDVSTRVDHVVAVSPEDAAALRDRYHCESVSVVPTGVDIDFFTPAPSDQPWQPTLVFTGAMDWLANEDGVAFLLDAVMPLVLPHVPDVRVAIVGRNPSEVLRARARRTPWLEVTGSVPDVRPWLNRAAAFVVPLRIGGGTRLKVFEALAMERPLVATTIAVEGLPLTPGEHYLAADTAEAFATALLHVIRHPGETRAMARRAAGYVRQRFTWAAAAEEFARACDIAIARYRARGNTSPS
jgi:glycosyltransferase involved in cell wall biosynthesis